MVHPLLTAAFDLFLIGSAVSVIAAIVAERFRRHNTIGCGSRPHHTVTSIRIRHASPVGCQPRVPYHRPQSRRAA